MKPVYVEKDKNLEYFICGLNESNIDNLDEYSITGISEIGERAFHAPWNVKRVFFDENLAKIKKEAFKDADELEVFCCAEKDAEKFLKGVKLNKLLGNKEFSVETLAFSGCVNLHTVIFPVISSDSKIIIEKDAFSGCESLRTVVLVSEEKSKIEFTENPFSDCPEYLTFVCEKDSAVDKFARENGYNRIYVS